MSSHMFVVGKTYFLFLNILITLFRLTFIPNSYVLPSKIHEFLKRAFVLMQPGFIMFGNKSLHNPGRAGQTAGSNW